MLLSRLLFNLAITTYFTTLLLGLFSLNYILIAVGMVVTGIFLVSASIAESLED